MGQAGPTDDSEGASMQETGIRGQLELRLLRTSVAATLGVSCLGFLFGLMTGSFAILFDGVYALIDAMMGTVTLLVARLILHDSLKRDAHASGPVRYQYGFWHLEPMVLALNATMLTLATIYALVSALMLIAEGGTDLDFNAAILYAALVSVICFGMALRQRRQNRRLGSAFVALDAKSWLMSGAITLALLVAFGIGRSLEGTNLAWMQPYIDPAVLCLVCLVVIPLPFADLRQAVRGILRTAPEDLDGHVIAVAAAAQARHGLSDAYTYVAQVGRATLIEINFITPAGWPVTTIAKLDAIRQEVGDALGNEGPDRWLTISFTEKANWAL
jgi:predicted Co/Zn/Cd cation transporter (cation efflux family)